MKRMPDIIIAGFIDVFTVWARPQEIHHTSDPYKPYCDSDKQNWTRSTIEVARFDRSTSDGRSSSTDELPRIPFVLHNALRYTPTP